MYSRSCLLLMLAALGGGTGRAESYLLRVEPVATQTEAAKKQGTIEFSAVAGEPFFVRSTLGNGSQFLLRGSLRKTGTSEFEIDFFCQIAELRADPSPRLTREGTVRLTLNEDELVSGPPAAEELSSLNLRFSIKPLNPVFGALEATSGFSVRLVDTDGNPVANAHGGLYGVPYWNTLSSTVEEDVWEPIVHGMSNDDGIIRFSEGRESLLWLTFYAEHEGRKLYSAAHLNPDLTRATGYKYYTIEMTESFARWSRPQSQN